MKYIISLPIWLSLNSLWFIICSFVTINHTDTPVSQIFGAGMGPILLDNVVCQWSKPLGTTSVCAPTRLWYSRLWSRRRCWSDLSKCICYCYTATTNIHLLATNTQWVYALQLIAIIASSSSLFSIPYACFIGFGDKSLEGCIYSPSLVPRPNLENMGHTLLYYY